MSRVLGVTLTTLMLGSVAFAQPTPRRTSAVIIGTVSDTGLRPIFGADVNFAGSNVRASSDSLGRFQVVSVPAGKFILIVRNIGYAPATEPIEVADGDTLRLAFTLERSAQELSAIVITEKRLSPRLAGFGERRKAGFGKFFNREDIDKISPITVGDIVRRALGVQIVPADKRSGLGEIAVSMRAGCPMQVYVDDVALGATDLTFLPPPSAIAAIEVYAGLATLPIWLAQGPPGSSRGCGAILVWTKVGA